MAEASREEKPPHTHAHKCIKQDPVRAALENCLGREREVGKEG